jgi:serine/threonine protein kinase
MATQQEQQSIDILLECPITKTRFIDPVIAEDGHTYERQAIEIWLRKEQISPLTRQRMSVSSLRPNRVVKQLLDLEKKAEKQNYRFKLNIDVKKKGNRALVRNGDKFIYEAEWLDNPQAPAIIILHIRGVHASKEASFYVNLSRHPNIVRTFGIVEPTNEQDLGIMLLQEYASQGDLSELLQNESTLPNNLQIFCEIFLQIIDAMTYLVKKNIVHGDLACRNILVFNYSRSSSKDILVKLTDFGLTRTSTIYQTTNYSMSTTNIVPLRSSAPEVLQSPNNRQSYTEKSDIFSMGVLMWECLSKGNIPWMDFSEEEIKRKVLHGERLKQPKNGPCSIQLWSIILMCMAHRPQDRPTFVQLDRLISDLFPSRTSMCTRYAQYTSLQCAASQSVIVSAVQNNELQEVTGKYTRLLRFYHLIQNYSCYSIATARKTHSNRWALRT